MYVIKTQKLAGYLMQKGFELIRLQKDRNNKKKKVFLFEDTDYLRKAITDFTNNKSNRNSKNEEENA